MASCVARDFNGRAQIGKESTPGTPVTPTVYVDSASGQLTQTQQFVTPESTAKDHGFSTSARYSTKTENTYALSNFVDIEGTGIIWEAVFGKVATVDADPVFTHTYTTDPTDDVLPSYTIEHVLGDDITVQKTIDGAQVNSCTINMPHDNLMTVDTEWYAMTVADWASVTSLSDSSTTTGMRGRDITTATLNSVDIKNFLLNATVTISNNLERLYASGNQDAWCILNTGKREVTATLQLRIDATTYDDYQDLHLAGTEVTLVIAYTVGSDTWTLTARGCRVTQSVVPGFEDRGMMEITVNLQARQTTSNDAITLVVVNGESSGIANGA